MRELRAYKDMEPTFDELAKALEILNFYKKNNKEYFVYINDEFDASVVLSLKRRNGKVNKENFAALSWGLEQQGVIEHEYDLGKMIEQHRLEKTTAAA